MVICVVQPKKYLKEYERQELNISVRSKCEKCFPLLSRKVLAQGPATHAFFCLFVSFFAGYA